MGFFLFIIPMTNGWVQSYTAIALILFHFPALGLNCNTDVSYVSVQGDAILLWRKAEINNGG